MTNELRAFLSDLRQHPLFPQLLAAVEQPRVRPYRPTQASEIERARAQWIYESGQLAQHNAWLAILTGNNPSERGEPT